MVSCPWSNHLRSHELYMELGCFRRPHSYGNAEHGLYKMISPRVVSRHDSPHLAVESLIEKGIQLFYRGCAESSSQRTYFQYSHTAIQHNLISRRLTVRSKDQGVVQYTTASMTHVHVGISSSHLFCVLHQDVIHSALHSIALF